MLIKCNQTVKIRMANPKFEYDFNGQPVEVKPEHAKLILRNPDFKEFKKVKKVKGEVNGRNVS